LVAVLAGLIAGLGHAPGRGRLPGAEAAVAEAPQAADQKTEHLRLVRDEDKNPVALETAVTRYVPTDNARPGVAVDLIGAVHVADRDYYAELNKRFKEYDAVLYELVAPEGTRVPKGGGESSHSGVSVIQVSMTKALNLAFQLDEVDYTAANMVHADLSPEEFAKSMRERGESFSQIFFRVLAKSMAEQTKRSGGNSDIKMLSALFSRDRDHQLKIVLAEQFADMEGAMDIFNGPDGSTLVTVRNTRAVEVLRRELQQGKKKVAIFYGAAHMSDMAEQIEKELAFRQTDQQWVEAWDLRADKRR
jgi:hypothetical protein